MPIAFVALFGIAPPSQGWLGDPKLAIFSILVVACWQYTGYAMVIVLAGCNRFHRNYGEAAALDGAGEVRKFISVTCSIRNATVKRCTNHDDWRRVKVFDPVYILTRWAVQCQVMSKGTYGLTTMPLPSTVRAGASSISVVLLITA
ncbi:MAG: ABC transporter permease subunit [Caldilineaceae bacterium]